MFSALDFFGPNVYIVSDKMYQEYKKEKLEKRRASLNKDLEYYKNAVVRVEKQLVELEE